MDMNQFGPRLSFFLDCGLDAEYLARPKSLPKHPGHRHVRDGYNAAEPAPGVKLHTQTSGRSLIAKNSRII